ncbi:iron-containing alcohol dehydrogenase [Alphaproteobacteria bacterium]|nr:iron-containing alcohol dehydrogenase [Alphaproteobacteria bacterium]
MTNTIDYDFGRTQRLVAGVDAARAIAAETQKLGAQRVFVMASASTLADGHLASDLKSNLGRRLAGIHSGIAAHAPQQDILDAAEAARTAQADILVAIGGGTPIDSTKIIQLCLTHDITDKDQLTQYAQGGGEAGLPIDPKVRDIRTVAVPTTLSGAEFASLAGALVVEKKQKQGFSHPDLAPIAIIFDPKLGAKTPASLWYSAAVRTLDHGAEGFLSPDGYPVLQAQFLDALRLMSTGLKAGFAATTDDEKHAAMMLSFQGVWSVAPALGRVRMGASHGLGYILGGMFGVAHGETSCVLLPAVLQWNAQQNPDAQIAISQALGDADKPAHELVAAFIQSLGLPSCLADVGITPDKFDAIAQAGVDHGVVTANSRAITRREDILEILALASR